jgi:ParB family chromosome partitioning protein
VGEGVGDSENQVRRFIRLTNLESELLAMVDSKSIKFMPGVELSYMSKEDQNALISVIEKEGVYPTLSQAKELRQLSKDGECTEAAIFKTLALGNRKERRIVLGEDILMRYFHADMTDDEMKRIIIRLLDDWAEGRR